MFLFVLLYGNLSEAQNWRFFTPQETGLSSAEFLCIKPTSKNKIWIGTNKGAAVYDWNTWLRYDSLNSIIPLNNIIAIEEDAAGDIWLSAACADEITLDTSGGLVKYSDDSWTLYNMSNSPLMGYFNSIIAASKDTSIWVFSWPGSLSGFGNTQNIKGSEWYTMPMYWTESFAPTEFKTDSDNNLWITSFYSRLLKFNRSGFIIYNSQEWTNLCSYPLDLDIDQNGNIWMAVSCSQNSGIVKFDRNIFTYYPFPDQASAGYIAADNLGNIWVGTTSAGLFKFSGDSLCVYNTTNSPIPSNTIKGIETDIFNNVWLIAGNTLTVFNEHGIIIPVEMVSFTAQAAGSSVILNWITASETNNLGFYVERNSGAGWIEIGFKEGSGTSTEPKQYSFTDFNPGSGELNYRLRQTDLNGTASYSDVLQLNIDHQVVYNLYLNYPNPFNPSTTIKYSLAEKGRVILIIFDLLGREIIKLIDEEKLSGEYEINWNASSYPSGVYFLRMQAEHFSETRKLILMK
jgi:hypothetical protein